jgi:hypothetical protein
MHVVKIILKQMRESEKKLRLSMNTIKQEVEQR